MEEIRRLPDTVSAPQPVGKGHANQPGKRAGDEFKEILERERSGAGAGDGGDGEKDERPDKAAEEQARQPDDERGLLVDERA